MSTAFRVGGWPNGISRQGLADMEPLSAFLMKYLTPWWGRRVYVLGPLWPPVILPLWIPCNPLMNDCAWILPIVLSTRKGGILITHHLPLSLLLLHEVGLNHTWPCGMQSLYSHVKPFQFLSIMLLNLLVMVFPHGIHFPQFGDLGEHHRPTYISIPGMLICCRNLLTLIVDNRLFWRFNNDQETFITLDKIMHKFTSHMRSLDSINLNCYKWGKLLDPCFFTGRETGEAYVPFSKAAILLFALCMVGPLHLSDQCHVFRPVVYSNV